MWIRSLALAPVLAIGLAPAALALDTSKPVLCAVTQARECDVDGECIPVLPEEMNLPPFLLIDVPGKTISEFRGERSTPVRTVTERGDDVFLQGFEERAFSISLSRQSGRLSATAATPGFAFVLFGTCTEL